MLVGDKTADVFLMFTSDKEPIMPSIRETALRFFDACETGKGWEVCKQYCHPDATFSAQAGALTDVNTLEGYTGWMKGLLTPLPDGSYEVRSFAVDEGRSNVIAYGVFRGTHTADGKASGGGLRLRDAVRWRPDPSHDKDLE